MAITIENIKNPSEKIRLMYEAVSQLIREQNDISKITVSAITQKAGIGKGTAYEYFSSKEEIISAAMMYEYGNKLAALAKKAFVPELFVDRMYEIFDWIKENKEYNHMFSQLMSATVGNPGPVSKNPCEEICKLKHAAFEYIFLMIDKFMKEGYEQGAFTETDVIKRRIALLTAAMQYSVAIMGPNHNFIQDMGEDEFRKFIYHGLVATLS